MIHSWQDPMGEYGDIIKCENCPPEMVRLESKHDCRHGFTLGQTTQIARKNFDGESQKNLTVLQQVYEERHRDAIMARCRQDH